MEQRFVINEDEAGKRIDLVLVARMGDGYSRSSIQRLILNNSVMLNGFSVKPNRKVSAADDITVTVSLRAEVFPASEKIDLKVIHEDSEILVIDKPCGLVVHPAVGNRTGTLVNALLSYTRDLSSVNPGRPGIVHRLDKETSGVMVVARNNASHLNLSRQFAAHKVKKKYVAFVHGVMEFDEGVIDLPIGRHKTDFRRKGVTFINSREALTRYRVLRRFDNMTFLELSPETGRTHQLRVHLFHLGHPIVGDSAYGKPGLLKRLALHATELCFFHPGNYKFVKFCSKLPAEFKAILNPKFSSLGI